MMIYLDNASTTRPIPEATDAMLTALESDWGNPSSLHGLGIAAEKRLTAARQTISSALHCDKSCILFTSGATESNNTAIFSAADQLGRRKTRFVTDAVEHPSVDEAFKTLEQRGFEVVRVMPDANGCYSPEAFLEAVNDNTALVSMMLVNNETGTILPVAETFKLLKKYYPKLLTHCDAVQAFMKLPVLPSALSADYLSLSGHKIGAPKGVGALYVKKGTHLMPFMHGGGQENKLRSGTENVPAIAAFGTAVSARVQKVAENHQNVTKLNHFLREGLTSINDVVVNSPLIASPYILNFSVAGVRSEIMLHALEERGIYVSSGSACSKGMKSRVLSAFGVPATLGDSALRVSFSPNNTTAELEAFLEALKDCAKRYR